MGLNSASDVSVGTPQFANINPTLSQLPSSISQLSGTTVNPSFQQVQTQLGTPTASQALTGAQSAAALGGPVANNVMQATNSIFPYAQQVFQTGMDPQNQLYNWLQNQNTQQARAANAAAGVGTTPYGAAVEDQANMLFNINWQNQQLQRQIEALQAGTGAVQTGAGLQEALPAFVSGTSAIPYATQSQITGTNLSDLAQYANIGNLPITDLLSLLTGQNQSNQVANQTSQVGLQQSALETQQLAALVSGVAGLAGGALGGGGVGLGALGGGVNSLLGGLLGGSGTGGGGGK